MITFLMARIGLLLTTTPWNDRRQFDRQAPALVSGAHDVLYLAVNPDPSSNNGLSFVPLSPREGRLARFTGGLNQFGKIKNLSPDAIQLCSIEQLPLGLALRLTSDIKVTYDCREDMYHSMRDHKTRFPKMVRQVFASCVKLIEGMADRWFDGIVASDRAIHDSFESMPNDQKTIFYNTPLLSMFEKNYQPLSERPYDVVVMGSMSPRTGVLDLVQAIGLLKRRETIVKAMLLGDPSNDILEPITRVMQQDGIDDQIHITGRIPHSEVPKTLATCKIGIVPLPDMPKFRNNIACKAFEYMACGMPVICTDLPPQREFVIEGKNGFFYEPGNVGQLANAIEELLVDLPRANELGNAGRTMAEGTWNCEHEQEKYRRFYDRLLASNHH